MLKVKVILLLLVLPWTLCAEFLAPGSKVGCFQVTRHLGKGGFGTVVEVDINGNLIALKHLHMELYIENLEAQQAFVNEYRQLAQMQKIVPNIPIVYQAGFQADSTDFITDGMPFYTMEKLDGKSLDQLIKEDNLSLKEIIGIFEKTLQTLTKMHELGVIHRDIKPENIMVLANGDVKVVDFGLAHTLDHTGEYSTLTDQGARIEGTPAYMDVAGHSGRYNRNTDIHALTVSLFEALVGKRPYAGTGANQVTNSIQKDNRQKLTNEVMRDRFKNEQNAEVLTFLSQIVERNLDPNTPSLTTQQMLAQMSALNQKTPKPEPITKKLSQEGVAAVKIPENADSVFTIIERKPSKQKKKSRTAEVIIGTVNKATESYGEGKSVLGVKAALDNIQQLGGPQSTGPVKLTRVQLTINDLYGDPIKKIQQIEQLLEQQNPGKVNLINIELPNSIDSNHQNLLYLYKYLYEKSSFQLLTHARKVGGEAISYVAKNMEQKKKFILPEADVLLQMQNLGLDTKSVRPSYQRLANDHRLRHQLQILGIL